jgi:SAM-dependent methyltransferase
MNMNKVDYIHTAKIHNTDSASAFIPVLSRYITPRSVLDVGCGTGTWLRVFKDAGVERVLGIDGPNVDQKKLAIDKNEFLVHDLREKLYLGEKFDLGVCLEVVEHLPADRADIIIQLLVDHADTILFSAALPLQGGQNHINEQPFQYWVKKFNERGFIVKDCFRPEIWENEQIDSWYRQNLFLVTKQDRLMQQPIYDYYHPEIYKDKIADLQRFQQACDWLMATEQKYFDLIDGKVPVYEACKIVFRALKHKFK